MRVKQTTKTTTMKKLLTTIAAIVAITLSGCAINVPVAAKTSDGVTYIGNAHATMGGGPGTVTMYSSTGIKAIGKWDPWDSSPMIRATFTMSDGRHGTITVTRDPSGISGVGVGQISDGTTLTFFIGSAMRGIHSEW
jgi:hypothetical protein